MRTLAALLALVLTVPAPHERARRQDPPPRPKRAMKIVCTSNTIQCDDDPPVTQAYSIAAALSRAAPGAHIELAEGEYKAFSIGAKSGKQNAAETGGNPNAPIVVSGHGKVRVAGDSWALDVRQESPNGFITFQDIEFVPGKQAAICFESGAGWVHQGFRFVRCDVLGSGQVTHDGIVGWGLRDFAFEGPAEVSDLASGNAFELHHPVGDVQIDGVRSARIGRAFVELSSGKPELSAGRGKLTISNCSVEDCGLVAETSKEGQSAFSFAGRHDGDIVLRHVSYRAGFVEALRALPRGKRSVYGTGALELWCGDDGEPTGSLTLEEDKFEMDEGCGDRALVAISACGSVRFRGVNQFLAGGNPTALELEPPRRSRPAGAPIGTLSISKLPLVDGPITWRGTRLSLEEVLQKYPAPEPAAKR